MGRPTLALNTAGHIRFYKVPVGWRARCTYRDSDGTTREIERTGSTKNAAGSSLKTAMRDRGHNQADGGIVSDTRVKDAATAWLALLDRQGQRSPRTIEAYRYQVDRQIVPAIGNLRLREVSIGIVERFLHGVGAKHGASTAKMTKSVLSGVMSFAARHDAVLRNPVRETAAISVKPKKPPTSLELEELKQLLALLTYDDLARRRDLPDFIRFMAATGLRIGEASAITWANLDLDAGTVTVSGTVIRVKGQGLRVKPEPKSKAGQRTLELPIWCVNMLRERFDRTTPRITVPAFPAPFGGFRDPSNTQADIRQAFTTAGFPDVTSHSLRKTAATLMDQAGLSPRAAADQLGHSKPSVTMDVYYGRGKRRTGAAAVLEILGS